MKIILASGSPRRKSILEDMEISFEVIVPQVEETIREDISPEKLATFLASQKSREVAKKVKEGIIIGADTIVALEEKIFGKPESKEEAVRMLQTLSGTRHRVITGLSFLIVIEGKIVKEIKTKEVTWVKMRDIPLKEIEKYVRENSPLDKSGSYAVQEVEDKFVERIEGDFYNVVGFPRQKVEKILRKILKEYPGEREIRIERFHLKKVSGIGKIEGKEVWVRGGIPGDLLRVVLRNKKRLREGIIKEMIEPSPHRRIPPCPHYGRCGGCSLQEIVYPYQLQLKKAYFLQLWRKALDLSLPSSFTIHASPEEFSFRNKMEFVFGRDERGEKALGLHPRGKFWMVENLSTCLIFSEKLAPGILKTFQEFSRQETIYHPRTHKGNLRHLVVRMGKSSQEFILGLVVQEDIKEKETLIDIVKKLPNCKGLLLVKNTSWGDAVGFQESELLWGRDFVEEIMDGLRFHITLPVFFQTNPAGALLLWRRLKEILPLNPEDIVLDLYAGMGVIGLWLADRVKKVIAVEENIASVERGKVNCALNKLEDRVQFIPARVEDFFQEARGYIKQGKIQVLIIDPPRSGISPKVRKKILELGISTLVYISCNPVTFLEDATHILKAGYKLKNLELFDFFPQTPHLETLSIWGKDGCRGPRI
ncbi:MAG: 23S rRNA (uracil(1939)-C(5))-methyltransferase RlmD [Caldiserica bacterium]|nr:23S rRNA (uracil(1939)-C(5))-methyltransferase RlmD [Caldisericota bacterium]